MLTAEEKKRFLRTLEKDEEFRLAVAGLVGLGEILRELRELRRNFQALYQKSLEHDKRLEALERKMLEHDKRFEAIEKKLLEHDKRFEAIEKKLLEHDQRLSRVELELGALSESFYSFAFWNELREELSSRGEKLVEKRRNARVNGEDIDLLVVTDRSVYVVEVKTKPKKRDVTTLVTKTRKASRAFKGRETVAILAGTLIGDDVLSYAQRKKVKVYHL